MGKQFLDSDILNYTIKNLVSQIDKTFLKKNVLFNVTPAYYRLFDSATDNPSDKLTVIDNDKKPTTGEVTSDTVRSVTKNPTIYAVGAEVVHIDEVLTPKFDNIKGITENDLKTLKADTKNNRQNKYNSNILFVVNDSKLVFYDRTLDKFTDCTSNYNDLANKPSINGVTLTGDKSLSDLGIDLSKYTTTDKAISKIELVDAIPTGSTGITTEKCLRLIFADSTVTPVDVSVKDLDYDDTQVKKDIADLKSDKQDKTDNALDTTDKTVIGAINEINDSLLDNVTFSADYKNIIINRKNGLNPYTIPIASIINNAKIIELNDVDSTDIGNGKTLVYDGATQKHKYVDSTGTDELVKMDSTTDAKYLSDLIDKSTVVNDNGVLKVKKLDGQEVTIAEINHLKGLTMNVMDLVNAFANGGVKVLNTPVNTHADLSTLDRSTFLDGISYIVYVLADETHSGAKTTYLCDKTSETFFGNADSQRNFVTDPIDLANEVTGKLGTTNIDIDALWKLLTINDTYKTLTTKDEVFGTHGAKALYDELVASIGKKANATDLTTHTNDTDIHITTDERTKWNNIDGKVDKTSIFSAIYSTPSDYKLI